MKYRTPTMLIVELRAGQPLEKVITDAMRLSKGHYGRAAKRLGISQAAMFIWIDRMELRWECNEIRLMNGRFPYMTITIGQQLGCILQS